MSAASTTSAPNRPLLVELVGPPGAGKSTIFEALQCRDDRIEPRPPPDRRYVGVLAWNLLAVLALAVRHRAANRFVRESSREMAYLRALPRILEHRPVERVVVFDQGPIFLLTRSPVEDLAPWRTRMFEMWSTLFDVVVVLDAPDAVLVERINARLKKHRVKGTSVDRAIEFIGDSRAVLDVAVGGLVSQGRGPAVLRFDTSRRPVSDVVDEIVATLDRLRPGLELNSAAAS